jgi:hypothetical protein
VQGNPIEIFLSKFVLMKYSIPQTKPVNLMKKVPGILFLVTILLCQTSCTTLIYIGKTLEPEIVTDKVPGSIVFVNLFDYTMPVYVKEKHEVVYHAGVAKLNEGLSSSFSRDSSFSFFCGDTLKKGIEAGLLTALLPADSVKGICYRYKADLLLAMDSMNIFIDWETIADEELNSLKTKNFYLYTIYYLSLYSGSGDLINRSKVERSSLYKSRLALSGLITIKPSIVKARDEIGALAFLAGEDYVSKFYPQTVQVPKQIYTGKPFKESNVYLRTGNWSKAIELLGPLVKSSDPKTSGRAKQNLSVAREAAEGGMQK